MRAKTGRATRAELESSLAETTFVVVDLETTGGSAATSRITEVGAVKLRAGAVLGELQTLVDPGVELPQSVSALTGITPGMVATAPPIEAVLPMLLEFCHGAVLVAHNAGFDTTFLNAALARLAYPLLDHPVICTSGLARRLVADEVRNCKLSTLADFFSCRTRPTHRALSDARATVEVFHGLLERAGSFGALTLEDLIQLTRISDAPLYRARRGLADGLPHLPGVYLFRSGAGEVLYVGKASDLKTRVRSYFGHDRRRTVAAMLREAEQLDHQVCPTPIEAAVREQRLIERHQPRYNRRGKGPPQPVWLKLTAERFPRLSVVRAERADAATYLGPLPSRRLAEQVTDALHDVLPQRRCTPRIGPNTSFAACALAELGRCLAPCDGRVDPRGYEPVAQLVRQTLGGEAGPVLDRLTARMQSLADAGRFEEAATARERTRAVVGALLRAERVRRCAQPALLLTAAPRAGGHDVVCVRHGRLIASCWTTTQPEAAAAELAERAQEPLRPASLAERDLLARWMERPHVRVLHCDGVLASRWEHVGQLHRLDASLAPHRGSRGSQEADELAAKRTRRLR